MRILAPASARVLVCLAVISTSASGQKQLAGTSEIKLALDRLNVLGSALMIAAHPDDENTALLAWFARGQKLRTAYLSLTRGEGGQNLIGSEQGDLLGVIRTQELLAARRIDGAEQYFTRAIDFGFSKTADETLAKWGPEQVLADVVWVIRKFQPDVIVLRFSGTPRDGHGHHQSSAILGKDAFSAAADPKRFPEQLQWVKPWQAKRIVWNVFAFTPEQQKAARELPDRIEIDTGEFDPVLGYSYGEIAGMSRSQHRSQGMGAAERRGTVTEIFSLVGGEPPKRTLFDGIDTGWTRIPGGEPIGRILSEAAAGFKPERPADTIPALIKARKLMVEHRTHSSVRRKIEELDEALALCAGLWLDASISDPRVVPNSAAKIHATAVNRSGAEVRLVSVAIQGSGFSGGGPSDTSLKYNEPVIHDFHGTIPHGRAYTEPYWLRLPKEGNLYRIPSQELLGMPESAPEWSARFELEIGGQRVGLTRPVIHRYVDKVLGELTRPAAVVPPIALEVSDTAQVFPSTDPRRIEVQLRSTAGPKKGELHFEAPDAWTPDPRVRPYELSKTAEQTSAASSVRPPVESSRGEIRISASAEGTTISDRMVAIDYPHIPPQTVFPPASVPVVRTNLRTLAKRVGYVMGAGDEVPEALRQMGCSVQFLSARDLAGSDLSGFDAIVTGVRAYNVRPDLRANQHRLLDYVKNGGTMIVQYNVLEGGFMGGDPTLLDRIGPYPIKIGRDRVTVEEAPVTIPEPNHPVLRTPNEITSEDFNGWVQERGLYFASQWDERYQPLLVSADPGEDPLRGGMLFAKHGDGVYIFSAYSWFRQLPAGVPGAYRLFANMISAGKAAKVRQ